ncbi:MAG TPA: alpha-E domain-containing protein, partial [Polyangiaceae bacterium]|nr:alpha-E domain-containing protein [Polyangiaceae bacterium]
ETVAHFLSFDRRYPNSVVSCVSFARENARTVREVISREMWQQLNELYLMVKDASKSPGPIEEMADYFERVKLAGIHYAGVTDATLSHGEAWHFCRLGRLLERADKTSRILDVKYFVLQPSQQQGGPTIDQVGWTALLNSASALQMYRQTEHIITPRRVARFLLLSDEFPRSIRHCVKRAQRSLHALTGTPVGNYKTEAERLLGKLVADLDYADIDQVVDYGLHEYLDELQTTLNAVSSSVHKQFFEHAEK